MCSLRKRCTTFISLMIAVLAISALQIRAAYAQSRPDRSTSWVATWTASLDDEWEPRPTFENQTIRMTAHVSAGGDKLRVQFSSLPSDGPVEIRRASVALSAGGAKVVPHSLYRLTFEGERSLHLKAGDRVWSDPVDMDVPNQADVVVTIYIARPSPPAAYHGTGWQTSYISPPGDYTMVEDMPVADQNDSSYYQYYWPSWYWLTGIEVRTRGNAGAIVTFGDSITEGYNSSWDANMRYPDTLGRLLLAHFGGQPVFSVVNAGISGNRVLNQFAGPSMLDRLDRDVLSQRGVTHVVFLGGINDLDYPIVFGAPTVVNTDQIIEGYKEIIARVHARHIKIIGGTLLPVNGSVYGPPTCPDTEAQRQILNAWIRTSGAFDAVADFDAVLRDPIDPTALIVSLQSGDLLHPNDAGYAVMAQTAENAILSLPCK